MVRKSVLDRFTRLGGYGIVERKRGKWRKITEASKKTGISRTTIYRLLAEYPEPLEARVRLWIDNEDFDRLKETYSALEETEKLLERVQKYFSRALIVDLVELRARQEIQGMSLEEFRIALKRQAESDEKQLNALEKILDNALWKLRSVLVDLSSFMGRFRQ